MSSLDCSGPNKRTHRSAAVVAVLSIALLLGGCLRPLYGPTSDGSTVKDVMASVEVVVAQRPNQEMLAHYVESELAFNLDGSGKPPVKRFRLEMVLSEQVATSSVNQSTGQAVSAILTVNADFKLLPSGGGAPLLASQATASAGYDRTPQRFADVRAARDAQIRASKVLAEQIQTRLAAYFVSRAR